MKLVKVGLVRHFKVKRGYPNKIVSGEELLQWMMEYDASDVEENEIDLCNVEWKGCYSSTLPRAKVTAKTTFNGDIVYLEELREVGLAPLFNRKIRLPLFVHILIIRIAWIMNHKSQPELKEEVYKRINYCLDKILEKNEDALIIGHGGIMMFMRKELIRRGFIGPKFRRAINGKVYIFEK
jgi:broad specificity phosphatase PhoE